MNDLEKRKLNAVKEIRDLLDWSIKEEERITTELKRLGKLTPGLDGNSEIYASHNKKVNTLMKNIFDKYGLPPDTRLKLW